MYYLFLLAFVFFLDLLDFGLNAQSLFLFFLHKKEGILFFVLIYFNGKKGGWRREKEK